MPVNRVLNADFHIHSFFSADSDISPEDIIKYAKKAGLDAIAVTDHNSIKGGIETQKISKKIIVFVGSEIKTKEGEVIGLNLKKDVPYGLSLMQTCKLINKQNGFVIVPHPFDKFRNGIGNEIEKIVKYIDAVEIFNARTLVDGFNKQSFEFAKKYRLPFVAGSDSHFKSEIGSAYTLINCNRNKEDILKAVKGGRVKITGKKSGIMPHWKTFVTKIGKKF
jgi:hypothetical protein